MKKETKRKLIEWLISFAVTLILLGLVVAGLYWYMSMTRMELDMKAVWIGNAVGGIIMLLIVHHFVKKPKEDPYQ
jgi:membrane protein YdbS with pleckstrin-like domain